MRLVSAAGLVALLFCAWALSYDRRAVRLRPVLFGLGLQLLLALIILRDDLFSFVGMGILAALVVAYLFKGPGAAARSVAVKAVGALGSFGIVGGLYAAGIHGARFFDGVSDGVSQFLALADFGARFLFGNLADPAYFWQSENGMFPGFGFQFAFKVLPTILFFGGFMAVLYHLGVMQKIISALSQFVRFTMGTSGPETLSCTANIFVGQTEAPLLIKPFLATMTRSEILTIMVGGFATIAGGVLAGYIGFGIPAGHLLAASVMSAPAALVVGKIIAPEVPPEDGDEAAPPIEIERAENVIEAATAGITDGMRLAVNVGAMLIGFIALVAAVDWILSALDWLVDGLLLGGEYYAYSAGESLTPATGEHAGIFPGSLQTLFGTLLRPLAFLMGVPWEDAGKIGHLLGIKLSLNEFVAYGTLGEYLRTGAISERASIIATYALCGFANFSSIGIQIGALASVAPERRGVFAEVGLRAMLGGALASWITATIAGMMLA